MTVNAPQIFTIVARVFGANNYPPTFAPQVPGRGREEHTLCGKGLTARADSRGCV
jgi:hypothetical protein